jgi:uncharacterized protein YcfL
MKFTAYCIVLLLIFSLSACKSKNKLPNNIQLGMLIETPEKLAGIPLASTPAGGTDLPVSIDLSDKMPPHKCSKMQKNSE